MEVLLDEAVEAEGLEALFAGEALQHLVGVDKGLVRGVLQPSILNILEEELRQAVLWMWESAAPMTESS